MARTRLPSNLLGLVESDSEDDLGGLRAAPAKAKLSSAVKPAASTRGMPAAKRGRPAANKVTKPVQKSGDNAAATRRAGERRGMAVAAALAEGDTTVSTIARGRRVLADKTNEQPAGVTAGAAKGKGRPGRTAAVVLEDLASETEEQAAAPAKKRGRGRPKAAAKPTEDALDSGDANKPAKAREGRSAGTAGAAEDQAMEDQSSLQEPEIPETQFPDSMVVDESEATNNDTRAAENDTQLQDKSSLTQASIQSPVRRSRPHPPAVSSAARVRNAAASDVTSDIAVRRRLGDLTKKYDMLETRYRDLKEIGVHEADRNFDRLKKQGDDRAKASNDLIAGLKAELASYRDLAKDGARAKRELEATEARAAELQAQVAELQTALGDAKAETKTLSTKLAAARNAADALPSMPLTVVPGSAIKSSSSAPVNARAAVEAMQANSQLAQLKEDLYGDLTGLLVRSAKREGGSELYDCIQTGRNGSLHFKLCIETETDGDDEAQFVYMPQLDPSRDAALIDRLPDYLVEEISFPRVQAAKFYKRVMQSLTEEL